MTNDHALQAWREAARNGGLPSPRLERWQALRAGVVNLWEFEAVEYWYADGWVQLMGRNETGKSSLMALTTLIPWLGDTSSDKIDTLGRSGKQFSYYVRPTGAEGDRREATASLHQGWLWVEYGRLVDGEPRFFTTLLHASARSGNPHTKLRWCTADDSRVREALALTVGREIQPPKAIAAPGFEIYATAAEYKARLASRLLDSTVDQLEGIGKILKVTRTPKLGAQLDARFVTERLREALPELRRGEIEQLARGWDQLDQMHHDLEQARAAAATVATFARTAWRPWLGATLRLVADEVTWRQTDMDGVTRRVREAETQLAATQTEAHKLEQELRTAQTAGDQAATAAEALRDSAEYRDAHQRNRNLEQARNAHQQAKETHSRSVDAHGVTEASLAAAQAATERAAAALQDAEDKRDRRADDVRASARPAGIEVLDPMDPALLTQLIQDRRGAVEQLQRLAGKHATAQQESAKTDSAAATAEAAAESARQAEETAWNHATTEHDAVASALQQWVATAPQPVEGQARWVEDLPTTADLTAAPSLTDSIRAQWLEPHRQRLEDKHRAAATGRQDARAQRLLLEQQIAELESAGVAPPTITPLWTRRSRTKAPGAPLWRLLNPAPEASPEELAHVEAALAAAGLLDAWVSDAGVRDALDTFVSVPRPVDGPALSRILQVAPESGELESIASGLLEGIALRHPGEELPPSGISISTDGRWRTEGLTGRALPLQEGPEWLGEAAREAQRQRRLGALRQEAEQLVRVEQEQAEREADLSRSLDALHAAFQAAPRDAHLRTLLTRAGASSDAAESTRATAAQAAQRAEAARMVMEREFTAMRRFAEEHQLPGTPAELQGVQHALTQTRHALERWNDANTAVASAQGHATDAATAHELRRGESQAAARRLDQDERQLQRAASRVATLQEAIGADDAAIFARLEQLRQEAQAAQAQTQDLQGRQAGIMRAQGQAEATLVSAEADRDRTTQERGEAHRRFRRLIDADAASDLELQLQEPHSSAVEHVRAQASEVRRVITPRNWSEKQEDKEANEERVGQFRVTMERKSYETRAALEQGGRSLQITPGDPLDSIEVTVDGRGQELPLVDALAHLVDTAQTLEMQYDEEVRRTLDELLSSTFLEHMREQIGAAMRLIDDINHVLKDHATGTNQTTLRIKLEVENNQDILAALTGPTHINPEVQERVREFLKDKVDEARRSASNQGLADWHDSLAHHLDYRTWFTVALERRFGMSSWGPLTVRSYAELSGGARAVMLMLPLIAALTALYRRFPTSPRHLWLDEAFDGLDATNRSTMMSLLRAFDLDVLLAGPGRLVNVAEVPAAAIYQVVRAPAPEPGADLTLELWAGSTLESIDLPLSWLDEPGRPSVGQDTLM